MPAVFVSLYVPKVAKNAVETCPAIVTKKSSNLPVLLINYMDGEIRLEKGENLCQIRLLKTIR